MTCANGKCPAPDLRPPCPRCGGRTEAWSRACTQCDFDLTVRPAADDKAREARRRLLIEDDREAAKRLAEEALRIWPGHPGAEEILRDVREREMSADKVFEEVEALQARRCHVAALAKLRGAPDHPRREELRAPSQEAVRRAEELIQEGDRPRAAGEPDEAYERYLAAKQLCEDSAADERMQKCPPKPVASAKWEVINGHALVRWDKPVCRFGTVDFQVLAKAHAPPNGIPDEGCRVVAQAVRDTTLATPLEAGVPTYFSITARRNGVPADTAAVAGPCIAAAGVEDLRALAGPGTVALSYRCPATARRVEVTRLDAGGEVPVPGATTSSALDHDLRDGEPATYRVVVIYDDLAGGELRSEGREISATPGTSLTPLDDLEVVLRGGELVATFTPPASGSVQLFTSDTPPPFAPGESIGRADLGRLGAPLLLSAPGVARARLSAGTEAFVTPVTVRNGTYLVGPHRVVCSLQPVTDLKVRPLAGAEEFRAEFTWPAGATEVLLLYKAGAPPDSMDDRKAMRYRVPRLTPRAFADLRLPPNAPVVSVVAYALCARNGRRYHAQPAKVRVAVGQRRTVYYRVITVYENDRKGLFGAADRLFGRQRGPVQQVTILVAPDQPTRLPALGLFHHPGGRPLDRHSSRQVRVVHDPAANGDESYGPAVGLKKTFDLTDDVLEAGEFRLFPLDEDGAEGWRFIDIQG
jgi:hypothetical protein